MCTRGHVALWLQFKATVKDNVKYSYREKIDVSGTTLAHVGHASATSRLWSHRLAGADTSQKVNEYLSKLPVHFDIPKVRAVLPGDLVVRAAAGRVAPADATSAPCLLLPLYRSQLLATVKPRACAQCCMGLVARSVCRHGSQRCGRMLGSALWPTVRVTA